METNNRRFFKILVGYETYPEKSYYISAFNKEDAKNVVKKFKAFSTVVGSKIINAEEISYDEYKVSKEKIEERKNQLKSFEVTVSILKSERSGFKVEHFHVRAKNGNEAAQIVKENLKNGNAVWRFDEAKDVKQISYSEYKEKIQTHHITFYKVIARCGHVGDRMFYPVDFYVKASSAKEAVDRVKKYPRVKKTNATSGIETVKQITKEEYEQGKKEMDNNLFLHYDQLSDEEMAILANEIEARRREIRFHANKRIKQAEDKGLDYTEEKLKVKDYKRKKKDYRTDRGTHLVNGLKYAKTVFDAEEI